MRREVSKHRVLQPFCLDLATLELLASDVGGLFGSDEPTVTISVRTSGSEELAFNRMEEPMKFLLHLAVLVLAFSTVMAQENNRPQAPSTPAASQPRSVYNPSPEESKLIRLSQEWMDEALHKKN